MSKFAVYWISTSGFANEGYYYYGTCEACEARIPRDSYDCAAGKISDHQTLAAARKNAHRVCNREQRADQLTEWHTAVRNADTGVCEDEDGNTYHA